MGVTLEPSAFALGMRTPREVHTPESVESLAALLRASDACGDSVVFFGGGTLQGIGGVPERYDVAISLAALNHTLEYEYRDLTVAVEAGVTVDDLGMMLASHGQFVPLDAPRAERSTVGGVLASGWLGPRRATYGRPRDLVIGSTVVLADGTVAKAGGMVVKNVTGYDMSKLYVGSLGTLGAIVRANFKTLPMPESRRVAVAPLPQHTRERALAHVLTLPSEPAAALFITGFPEIDGRDGTEGRLLLLLEGSNALVQRATRELRSSLGSAGLPATTILDRDANAAFARLLDAYVQPCAAGSVTYRSTGLITDLVPRHITFAALAREHELQLETIADLRTGDFIARLSTPLGGDFLAERILDYDPALHAALGRTWVVSAPATLRERLAPWGTPPASVDKMRALKTRFDPNGTLAPGRLVGGI
ncbi:MAG: FAD-binding oxidoreductase [Vulcanimicrobiaceae bacterium]